MISRASRGWLLAGVFLTALATLAVEILDTRLLSVLAWYHLAFFAVSTAMFGLSAGAVRVFLAGDALRGDEALRGLSRYGDLLALSIPAAHVATLAIPIPGGVSAASVGALALTTLLLALPFYLSGAALAIALTRVPAPPGLVYGVDLIGAALGSLLVIPLLELSDVSTAALACGAVAAAGAVCFRRLAGRPHLPALGLALLLTAGAALNDFTVHGLRVVYPRGVYTDRAQLAGEAWTIHGHVLVWKPADREPFFWGAPEAARRGRVNSIQMLIDGNALTVMTRWDGDPRSIDWVRHDVTAIPYHLRRGGDVAVIGVGGGRDLLTALWAESRSVTGIEVNGAFLGLLEGPLRDYARLAPHPRVTLVHDEARSYLTRTTGRFDLIQMSLIDTFAATGAGALTLTENGLFTVEAWDALLRALRPGGILSVSRFYDPARASETSRLVSLGTAALLRRGVARPADHLALVSHAHVATLLASVAPLAPADLQTLERAARELDFELPLAPRRRNGHPLLERIAASRSLGQLDAVVAEQPYDYSPPTDDRPYFFNMLRPGQLLAREPATRSFGVVQGNLEATLTVALLWALSLALVAAVIAVPLARSGLPNLAGPLLAHALLYFGLIGAGYMLVQIALVQRLSVYLGHPTYAIAVVLFSMILATGIGSLLSDRIALEGAGRWLRAAPLGIAAVLLAGTLALQPLIDATVGMDLSRRGAIAAGLVAAMSLPLGFCFPLGLRLARRLCDDATPWLWGVSGGAGVLASVSAVAVSMWSGIGTNLLLACAAYAALCVPAAALLAAAPRAGPPRRSLATPRARGAR